MFEYIGEMGKDYIYSVAPLLEDALMDRLDYLFIHLCLSILERWARIISILWRRY